jgi:hypothetical protein
VKQLRPAARRLLSIAAATVAGLAAALVIASPASAHDPSISATTTCDVATGEWTVAWKVINDFGQVGTLTTVTPPSGGGTLTVIVTGATVPAKSGAVNGVLAENQTFPNSVNSATLSAVMDWPDDFAPKTISKTAYKPAGCIKAYTVAQTCDSITFTFKAPPAPVVPASAPLTDTGVYLAGASLTSSSIKLHPSVGSDVTFTLNSGDPDKVVSFPGSPGLTVVVTIDNFEKTHTFTHDPCPTTPSPSPSLATTGSSLSSPLGIGAALVLVGIGLIAALFMFRRRRTVAGS